MPSHPNIYYKMSANPFIYICLYQYIFRFSAFVFQRVPVTWLSRALRAFSHAAANWRFKSRDGQPFVFHSHFFFSKIFPKIVFIQYLLVRLGLEFGSGLFFKCGITSQHSLISVEVLDNTGELKNCKILLLNCPFFQNSINCFLEMLFRCHFEPFCSSRQFP